MSLHAHTVKGGNSSDCVFVFIKYDFRRSIHRFCPVLGNIADFVHAYVLFSYHLVEITTHYLHFNILK